MTAADPFVGSWTLDPGRSQFGPHHRPTEGRIVFALDESGHYVMTAHGKDAAGNSVVERPQRFVPDGKPHPVPDLPGLTAVTSRPDPRTIRGEVRREDGSRVGEGTYTVSEDGRTLTAVNAGFDSQLREFSQQTVWSREETGTDRG